MVARHLFREKLPYKDNRYQNNILQCGNLSVIKLPVCATCGFLLAILAQTALKDNKSVDGHLVLESIIVAIVQISCFVCLLVAILVMTREDRLMMIKMIVGYLGVILAVLCLLVYSNVVDSTALIVIK